MSLYSLYWKSGLYWYLQFDQYHEVHSVSSFPYLYLPTLTIRNLTLNILNLFTYFISLLVCNPSLLPPFYPHGTLISLRLRCPVPPCGHLLTLFGLQHSVVASSAWITFLPLSGLWQPTPGCLCGHPPYPALTLTPTWGSHPGWPLSCWLSSDSLLWGTVVLSFKGRCLP